MVDSNIIIQVLVAFVVCSIIGLPSYRIRVVSLSGLLSGYVMGVGVILFGGWGAFVVIFMFFVLSGATTKFHYDKKKKKGVAEAGGGARGYKNVFGNGILALFMTICWYYGGWTVFLAGYLGAAASATADTAGGEIGRLSNSDPYLITNLKRVPTGTEGAVSVLGKSAEVAICLFLGAIAVASGMSSAEFPWWQVIATTTVGGFIGATMDSYLGATLETTKDWFGNNHTNFFCTVAGAAASMALFAAF
jgi:uncharacterized protein (TIGR00297 family)